MSAYPPRVLITGGLGFLGRAVAQRFKAEGYYVVGIGRGNISYFPDLIFDRWVESEIAVDALHKLSEEFEVVVHCAGSSSVVNSLTHPEDAFRSNVVGTEQLLEYLRQYSPNTLLIHASSAAVYGAASDKPLKIGCALNPISPYGYFKQITELLLKSYFESFGLRYIAIRFFSLYGEGLQRQLLWDASLKLARGDKASIFWGTGQETRDWIHVNDAADLIAFLAVNAPPDLRLINGGNGVRMTIEETLIQLRNALGSASEIVFNGQVREGDPLYYLADMTESVVIGWTPKIDFKNAIFEYAKWVKGVCD